jgi:hypothetical protein
MTAARRRRIGLAAAITMGALVPATAFAHVERSSYWPDPAADCTVTPCAGGEVPAARSLASALNRKAVGDTRVVCQANSLTLLKQSIARAVKSGYDIRPTDHRSFSAREGRKLLKTNRSLYKMCHFSEIQPAVTASRNNDRVVVMPGLYTEPTSRAAKTFDGACSKYNTVNERGSNGYSYATQFYCPNDQNLIAVLGRQPGPGQDPAPREDRRGIPNLGPCLRCNLQVEGSGVNADDVVIDGGRVESGNHGPAGAVKDVGIRVDRADGFVVRNVTVRHVHEHGIYVLETDGYLLDRFKTYYAEDYGVLTFVEDHGLMQNCEAMGSGDSGLYPGAGADTGAQRPAGTEFRYGQEIRFCDSHHNASGYSGTDGNAVHVDHNNFYDNALGFTTDVFTAPGHPGFPQDSDLIEYNNFYSNNFNPYIAGSDIRPTVPVPVGTGLWIAGGNANVIRNNRFYDNWRRGVMLFSSPDALICGPVIGTPVTGCDPSKVSTSYDNRFYANTMGVAPGGAVKPNGMDFWWDAYPTNTGNCWFKNIPALGQAIRTSPASLPSCNDGQDPGSSMGTGDLLNEVELLGCAGAIETQSQHQPTILCPWFSSPSKPSPGRTATPDYRVRRLAADPGVQRQVCRLYAIRAPQPCRGGRLQR